MLAEEVRSCLLNYNEQVKYQVVGKNLQDLSQAWVSSYGETVRALVVDITALRSRVEEAGERNSDLMPRLGELSAELDSLAGR